ncbi:exodeoxyribonuclease VII small subunit [Porphyromonas sp.]|uniref:exodeoxyribonuclease VII small subunit n=1 Tax=Porphyromonas sp. TaxID=1924944 RepID=UPI0026DD994D|nr:exodeoxyribonuclease VII small subunit [Porphyromonas sp.]MDO4771479.1 exodeoxyribonuclease VII small subunit [Porphyromonas sp.]
MAKKDKSRDISTLTYDEALQESEAILNRLENEKLPIDQIIAESRRAAALIKHCKSKIVEVSKEVGDIIDDLQDDGLSAL